MISRAVLVSVVVASAILLGGCTPQLVPPAGPTESERRAVVQRALDRQWAATGLEGRVQRPEPDAAMLIADTVYDLELGECVGDAGITSWYFDSGTGLVLGDGTRAPDEQQLAYYTCFVRHPEVIVLSVVQREFIYDYYARRHIPCLGFHGYEVTSVPTRESFVAGDADSAGNWVWSPESALSSFPTTQEAWERLTRDCPPTTPGVEGWSYDAIVGG